MQLFNATVTEALALILQMGMHAEHRDGKIFFHWPDCEEMEFFRWDLEAAYAVARAEMYLREINKGRKQNA